MRKKTSAIIVIIASSALILLIRNEIENYKEFYGTELQEVKHIEKILKQFRKKEMASVESFLALHLEDMTEQDAMNKVYQYLSFPLQGICRTLKRIGGSWGWGGQIPKAGVDGDKFVCMDDIKKKTVNCIIYSFGISNQWDFEDYMDETGCQVFAYDHTDDQPSHRGKDIRFFKLGLGTEAHMKTLSNIIIDNGHKNTTIDYLKVDIEYHELTGLPDWLTSGALDRVNQLAMELHLDRLHKPDPRFLWLLKCLQDLNRQGFRLISHEVNTLMGPGEGGFYNFLEVVFMRDNIWRYLDD